VRTDSVGTKQNSQKNNVLFLHTQYHKLHLSPTAITLIRPVSLSQFAVTETNQK